MAPQRSAGDFRIFSVPGAVPIARVSTVLSSVIEPNQQAFLRLLSQLSDASTREFDWLPTSVWGPTGSPSETLTTDYPVTSLPIELRAPPRSYPLFLETNGSLADVSQLADQPALRGVTYNTTTGQIGISSPQIENLSTPGVSVKGFTRNGSGYFTNISTSATVALPESLD